MWVGLVVSGVGGVVLVVGVQDKSTHPHHWSCHCSLNHISLLFLLQHLVNAGRPMPRISLGHDHFCCKAINYY